MPLIRTFLGSRNPPFTRQNVSSDCGQRWWFCHDHKPRVCCLNLCGRSTRDKQKREYSYRFHRNTLPQFSMC